MLRIRRVVAVLSVATSTMLLGPPTAEAAPTLELTAPAGFSPNHDGRSDLARISVVTAGPAQVSVWIVGPGGAPVRRLADAVPVDGRATFVWNGRSESGTRVADARYRVLASAHDPDGDVSRHVPLVLDTKAPSFTWHGIAPEPLRGTGPVRFTFATRDRFSSMVELTGFVRDAGGRLVEQVRAGRRATGVRTISWDAHAPGWHAVAPGLYRVAVRVTDMLGNARTGRFRPFRDHRPVRSRVIHRVDGAGPRVALTFDDCGYGGAWGKILHALRGAHAEATFFCVGSVLPSHAGLARRTVALGNAVGSHTWDHRNLTGASERTVRTQVRRDQAAWWRRARTTPAPLFRPPDGSVGSTTLAGVGSQGFAWTVLWDVDPWDWSGISSAEIQRRVLSSARRGSIVVLHVKPRTAVAVPGILRGLRVRGLDPVTLPTLLRAGGLTR